MKKSILCFLLIASICQLGSAMWTAGTRNGIKVGICYCQCVDFNDEGMIFSYADFVLYPPDDYQETVFPLPSSVLLKIEVVDQNGAVIDVSDADEPAGPDIVSDYFYESNGSYTYTGSIGNYIVHPLATSTSFKVKFTVIIGPLTGPTAMFDFAHKLSICPCTIDSDCVKIAQNSKTVSHLQNTVHRGSIINVYPTLTNEVLNVESKVTLNRPVHYAVMNVSGKITHFGEVNIDTQRLHTLILDQIPEGIYFIKIEGEGIKETYRFIKFE